MIVAAKYEGWSKYEEPRRIIYTLYLEGIRSGIQVLEQEFKRIKIGDEIEHSIIRVGDKTPS